MSDRSKEVFEKTLDDVAARSITVVEGEPTEELPEVIGSTFKTITEENRRRMEFIETVLEHDLRIARASRSPTRPSP